jgi:hypothetical protein
MRKQRIGKCDSVENWETEFMPLISNYKKKEQRVKNPLLATYRKLLERPYAVKRFIHILSIKN